MQLSKPITFVPPVALKHAAASVRDQAEPARRSCSCKTAELLRSGWSLQRLQDQYKLIVKHHPTERLVQLHYQQTASNMALEVVQECRGLILEVGSWNIVSFPFKKFFNLGEKNAARLDWSGDALLFLEQ